MILIAESGTTKTDWALINAEGDTKYYNSSGFNPYYMNSETIEEILFKDLVPLIDEQAVKEIFLLWIGLFYSEEENDY